MQKEKPVCPRCNGTKFAGTDFEEKEDHGRKTLYPYAVPCSCYVNDQIAVRFPELGTLSDATPEDAIITHDKYAHSCMIFSGNERRFLYVVKSFFLKGFINRDYMIIEGARIIEEYHALKKGTTEWLKITALNQYDLLVLLFTSKVKYENLKDCVLDVIKSRFRLRLPTWIYAKDEEALKASKEYHPELEDFFCEFGVSNVDKDFPYKGYNEDESEVKSNETRLKSQDYAASL